jgi:hypothetical protein
MWYFIAILIHMPCFVKCIHSVNRGADRLRSGRKALRTSYYTDPDIITIWGVIQKDNNFSIGAVEINS